MLDRLELKVPPVGVFLAHQVAILGIARWVPGMQIGIPGRGWLLLALVVVGTAAGAGGLASFFAARTTIDPRKPTEASTLVTAGPYRWTRNPMYLGLLSGLTAWALYLSNALGFALLPGFVLYMNRFQIGPEERVMREKFGADYEGYLRRVRRWI